MAWLSTTERRFLETVSRLSHCNPFLPERIELERDALGDEFDASFAVWSKHDPQRRNVQRLRARVEPLAVRLRDALAGGASPSAADLALYEDLILYLLYDGVRGQLEETIGHSVANASAARRVGYWNNFLREFRRFLSIPEVSLPSNHDPAHLLAGFFQIRRAFHHIYHFIVGRSMPAAKLRAEVWQSIFTHDLRRYRRMLFGRMGDITTLIAGPSGTGKELVARAVGMSRYIPFDVADEKFRADFASSFHPLNVAALSPTLVESELFGHCRGAFTGAVSDRAGWLEICQPLGTVFLDEIGDLDAAIQVKLLRVLQTRTFQRLGESADRQFQGKIIAATNRDLADEMRAGRFREDFYYRLCSDMIRTPALREQIADSPDDLQTLVQFLVERVVGDKDESLAEEVTNWIDRHLGADYPWPGNIRELEQCVRNVMIRKRYDPPPLTHDGMANDPVQRLAAEITAGGLSADELLRRYCTLVYAQVGSYEQTAKRLHLDRRTVKSKVDGDLLARLRRPD